MRHKRRLDRMMKAAKWSNDKGYVIRFVVGCYCKQQWPTLLKEVRLDTYEKLAGVTDRKTP
jgi:hypothetical protein